MANTEDRYKISIFPGSTRIISLVNESDGSPWQVPNGTTVISKVVNIFRNKVLDLTCSVSDATRGLIAISVPNTDDVKALYSPFTYYYDLILTVNGARKFLPLSTFEIAYSPSLYPDNPLVALSHTPTPYQPLSSANTPSVAPTVIYVQDQIWVDNTGNKVQVTIEKQSNGEEFFKLTQVS